MILSRIADDHQGILFLSMHLRFVLSNIRLNPYLSVPHVYGRAHVLLSLSILAFRCWHFLFWYTYQTIVLAHLKAKMFNRNETRVLRNWPSFPETVSRCFCWRLSSVLSCAADSRAVIDKLCCDSPHESQRVDEPTFSTEQNSQCQFLRVTEVACSFLNTSWKQRIVRDGKVSSPSAQAARMYDKRTEQQIVTERGVAPRTNRYPVGCSTIWAIQIHLISIIWSLSPLGS